MLGQTFPNLYFSMVEFGSSIIEQQKKGKRPSMIDLMVLDFIDPYLKVYHNCQDTFVDKNTELYFNDRQKLRTNLKEIIEKFKLKSQIRHMASKDVLLDVLEKFTSRYINLTPFEKEDPEGRILPPLSNLGMGYVFEELIRRFNEENNVLKNKRPRRLLAAFLIVLGGVLIFLAPEIWAGLLVMAVGVAVEAAGIALERQA
jgi:hypothetical protein